MDRSGVTLERMRSFVRVAERGSLSAVAREQGLGQASVTRHLAALERALGVTLLSRTTRRVALTIEGTRYYEEARTILRLVDEASEAARSAGGELTGTIRLSATAALGLRHVARAVFAFQDLHPKVSIDLSFSDERIDLVREAADIAIRLGPLADSSMQRRGVGQSRRLLVASPAYLAARGRPGTPADLAGHDTIRMRNVAGSETLILHRDGEPPFFLPFTGRLLVDQGLAAREAVLAGRGIAVAHFWLVDDLLASGALEAVLPDYAPEPVPVSILIVPGRARLRRVRLLVDALTAFLREVPGIG